MDTTTRTPAQQAAYDRFMGTAQTVRDQHAQGILDDDGNYIGPDAQDATPVPVVHVDRITINRRGRAATAFVDAPLTSTPEQNRKAVEAHLYPGEYAQFDCIRRTGDPAIARFEYAVFA